LRLTLPAPSAAQDVVLDTELRWDDSHGNQLWCEIFERRTAQDGTAYSYGVLSADSGKSPTRLQIVNPDTADYVLRVTNRHGNNTGYTAAARLSLEPLDVPVDHSSVSRGESPSSAAPPALTATSVAPGGTSRA